MGLPPLLGFDVWILFAQHFWIFTRQIPRCVYWGLGVWLRWRKETFCHPEIHLKDWIGFGWSLSFWPIIAQGLSWSMIIYTVKQLYSIIPLFLSAFFQVFVSVSGFTTFFLNGIPKGILSYTPENQHGTWTSPICKGTSSEPDLQSCVPAVNFQGHDFKKTPSNNPFHKGIPGIQTTGPQTTNYFPWN